ncbi:MAG: hypothetical protein ACTSVY_04660 [Candidatus Helarchaeota archaeon]
MESNLKDIDLGKFKDHEKHANEDYIYLTIFDLWVEKYNKKIPVHNPAFTRSDWIYSY